MSVRGSLLIEVCVAFSRAGASPNRASLDAWAIAVGKTRPTAVAATDVTKRRPTTRSHEVNSTEFHSALARKYWEP